MKRSYRHWSRDEVVREIRRLSAEGCALNSGYIARNQPALAYAARKYVGSWEAALGAAGLDYSRIRRRNCWDKTSTAERILELYKAGEPLNVSAMEKNQSGLVSAAIMYFGTWRKAVESAGLDYSKIKRQKEWSKKEIVREIRRLHREKMKLDTTMVVRQQYRTLHAAAVRYFGSWADALRAARLERLIRK